MKHTVDVYPFVYNKILSGMRKIDIRLYDKKMHQISVGDTIEYVNIETKCVLNREVKGIALFENFEALVQMLSPEMIGYENREEIRVRVERMYKKEEQKKYGACALFLGEQVAAKVLKINTFERSA